TPSSAAARLALWAGDPGRGRDRSPSRCPGPSGGAVAPGGGSEGGTGGRRGRLEPTDKLVILRTLADEDHGALPIEDGTPARRHRERLDKNGGPIGEDGLDPPVVEHRLPALAHVDHGEKIIEDLRPIHVGAPIDEDAVAGIEAPQLVSGPGVDVEERRG